jgi:hypothetical protein
MGLHNLAKHVQEKGRGNDSELVHMTPREVQGLQALAKAHGGSLTVNPETGLVEAGFLEQVLPIAAAAAATYFTAGAAAPALSAALGSTAMGGLAAGTLAGAGVGGLSAALQHGDVTRGATMGGLGGAIAGGMGAYDNVGNIFSSGAPAATETVAPVVSAEPGYGAATRANMTPQQYEDIRAFTGQGPATPAQLSQVSAAQNTPMLINPDSSYANYGTVGRAAVLSAPGIGASFGVVPQGNGIPNTNQNFNFARLSPNFQGYVPPQPNPYYQANYAGYAGGGIVALAPGGPVEQMANQNNMMGGNNNMFPQSQQEHTQFATPTQMPTSAEVVRSDYDPQTNAYTGMMNYAGGGDITDPKKKKKQADLTPESNLAKMDPYTASVAGLNNIRHQSYLPNINASQSVMNTLGGIPTAASGGLASLGSYSDGGRLLKGPGDGMSDNIPAQIGKRQPARLADGEFVVPADVVSHIGNGSTDAGAKRLYSMMDKIRQARTGKKAQGKQINPNKYLPA